MDNISGTFFPSFVSIRRKQGFTLVELMVSIAVVAILSAIALPSMSDFLVRMRVDNEIIEVQRLLLTARNAAINSGQNSQLCPLKANDTCDLTTNWTGRIGVVSADGLIKEKSPIKAGDSLIFAFSNVTYNPAGQLGFFNGNSSTFSYCPKGHPDYSRAVVVTISGRSSLSADNNGDGKDQDRQNNNISSNCP
jgi:prepilin-type N-terminal cleavage/methylation domain-containing protein